MNDVVFLEILETKNDASYEKHEVTHVFLFLLI